MGLHNQLTDWEAAAELGRIGKAIEGAAKQLDACFARLPQNLKDRVEAVKGLEQLDTFLARDVIALADAIQGEVDAREED